MATRIPTRLTPREGRRFGLTVGGAFLVLAGVSWWRGHLVASAVLGSIGGALMVAGLVLPTHLGPVERGWMALAHAISRVTTPIVMAVMYFVVLTPAGLLRRTFAQNPLTHAETTSGFWKTRPANARRSASMERQF
jgi:saxitoxin biosynthesis operon SxtJ-like protein